jgi:cell division protein FtsX
MRWCASLTVSAVIALAACTSGSAHPATLVERPDAEVVISQHASPSQIAALRRKLSRSPLVTRFALVSRKAAFREFHRIFAHTHRLTKHVLISELPKSFRVELANESDRTPFQRTFLREAGVSGVTSQPPLADDRHLNIRSRFDLCRGYDQDLEVYLEPGTSAATTQAIADVLSSEPGVRGAHHVSEDEANRLFQCVYRYDAPEDALPASFAILVNPGADKERVVSHLESLPGVDEVRGLPSV